MSLASRDTELELLNSVAQHRPLGIHAHFRLLQIHKHLHGGDPSITLAAVKTHLNSMFDVDALVCKFVSIHLFLFGVPTYFFA